MIENLSMQGRSWTAVTRQGKAEDAVDVETGSQVGDERLPAEGAERGVTVIGTGGMYPEIENALAGMAKGDEKTVDVTFPADWRVAQLAGKSAQVHVKVEQVSEQVLPEAAEAFIRTFGVKTGRASCGERGCQYG